MAFDERLQLLCEIPNSDAVQAGDRLRAIDMMAKYGLGTIKGISLDEVEERMIQSLEIIRDRTSPEQYAEIVEAMEPVWA